MDVRPSIAVKLADFLYQNFDQSFSRSWDDLPPYMQSHWLEVAGCVSEPMRTLLQSGSDHLCSYRIVWLDADQKWKATCAEYPSMACRATTANLALQGLQDLLDHIVD